MAASAAALHRASAPLHRTRFIGRDHERLAARTLLLEKGVPLLTVIGPGGVGKTRLALRVVEDVQHAFADGVIFVDISSIREPALVLSAIAAALGMIETGERLVADILLDALHQQQILLVLDNCEQVLGIAPAIATLLSGCPALQILATSRARLNIQVEQELVIPPLATEPRDRASMSDLLRNEAVALFLQRARALTPDFDPTADELQAISECCRRVDGLPLAIELAAARLKVLSPQALAARLSDSLQILTGGRSDAPERQRTLRATIAWTYNLLSLAHQALFRQVGVFAGGFTLEAAESLSASLANGENPLQATEFLDQLETLFDWNLLQSVPHASPTTGAGPLRFAMLETIREYALEQLTDQGEVPAVRAAHAALYLALAEEADAEIEQFSMGPGLDRLESERANVRAALDYFRTSQDWEHAARLLIATHKLWQFRGPIREWISAAEMVLDERDALSSACNLSLRFLLGMLRWVAGNGEQALHDYAQCLTPARTNNDVALIVSILNQQAIVYGWDRRDWDSAIPLEQEAVALARAHDVALTFPLGNLGTMLALAGDPEQGILLIDEAIARDRASGFVYGLAVRVMLRGLAAHHTGDYQGAAQWWAESIQHFRACQDEMHQAAPLSGLADLVSGQEPARAAWLVGVVHGIGLRTGGGSESGPTGLFHALRANAEARSRQALGEAAYVEALTCGLRLPIAAAIEESLALARSWRPGPLHDALIAAQPEADMEVSLSAPRPTSALPPGINLTRREHEILLLLCQRLTDREIADLLYLSTKTVSNHVNNLRGKLGARNRREAAAIAVRQALV